MADYRPISEDRLLEFQRVRDYSFRPQAGPRSLDEDDLGPDVGSHRGAFEGDDLVSVCRHMELDVRVRGGWQTMGGLSSVATPPEARRRGHVRTLLAGSLAEYRDRGWTLSALWPFDRGFYGRYGWATGHRLAKLSCDPEKLSWTADHARGEFRPVRVADEDAPDDADIATLDSVYDAYGERHDLTVDRTDEWWREWIFGRGTVPYAYVWERDGEPAGYIAYTVDDGDDGRTLHARDFVPTDHEARLNLLYFCYQHDSQVSTVEASLPDDPTVLDAFADPAGVEYGVYAGPMLRVVDVVPAVEALDYAVDGSFVLAVDDGFADWNDDTFRVTVEGGAATAERVDADPDVAADVETFTQLYLGYFTVEQAERLGDLSVRDDAARDLLASLYPPRDLFVNERF